MKTPKIHIAEEDSNDMKTLCGRDYATQKLHAIYISNVFDSDKKFLCKVCKEMYNANYAGERKLK